METFTDPDGPLPARFPMSVRQNGYYSKKSNGRTYYFGLIKDGWRAALKRFNHDWPFILQGAEPPPMLEDGAASPTSWNYVANAFVERELGRVQRGQLGDGHFIEKRNTLEIAVTHVGGHKPVGLRPDGWADLRSALSFQWTREVQPERIVRQRTFKRIGADTHRRRMIAIREMMGWAVDNLGIARPAYGDQFDLPSQSDIRLARTTKMMEHGHKRWEVEQIALLRSRWAGDDATALQLDCAFLLTLLLGYSAIDCGCLPWRAINWREKTIRFPRIKTNKDRIGFLPPILVEKLKKVRALNLQADAAIATDIQHQYKDKTGNPIGAPIVIQDLVFLRPRTGRPWVRRGSQLDAEKVPAKELHVDGFADALNKHLKALKMRRPGLAFGTGRHTFESHALRVADKPLVDFVMGHGTKSMSENYDHPPIDDLQALAKGVAARLGLLHVNKATKKAATAAA